MTGVILILTIKHDDPGDFLKKSTPISATYLVLLLLLVFTEK